MEAETVILEGHIVDSLLLAKVLDTILDAGADYHIIDFTIGRTPTDPSRAVIEVTASNNTTLQDLLDALQVHGANRVDDSDALLSACDRVGVLPHDFTVTTNLDTDVRIDGRWLSVTNPEMDCAIVVDAAGARTVPMHRVRVGDQVVVGRRGVRVHSLMPTTEGGAFEFMASEVSTEKPKALQLARVVDRMRAARERGRGILVVCGPVVVHTGGAPHLARLVRDGWVDAIFSGNGFATHDIESNVLGTSLGVSVAHGVSVEGGHTNHLRVINDIRRYGSIAAAVADGYVTSGVMYECIRRGIPFVLGGSVRDDGPLPDTLMDLVEAQERYAAALTNVQLVLMLSSMLHSIGVGNMLPSWVRVVCVDINPAVVTKLSDRGSQQTVGVVTDVGLFLHRLAEALRG